MSDLGVLEKIDEELLVKRLRKIVVALMHRRGTLSRENLLGERRLLLVNIKFCCRDLQLEAVLRRGKILLIINTELDSVCASSG